MENRAIEFEGSPLDAAICIAVQCHAGQVDKAGKPYILHPLRVMLAVKDQGEQAMITAVLHDCIEDSELTVEDVRKSFGPEVAEAVDALSRRKGQETYAEFIQRLKPNATARIVKLADLDDNLARFYNPLSMILRYQRAAEELRAWENFLTATTLAK